MQIVADPDVGTPRRAAIDSGRVGPVNHVDGVGSTRHPQRYADRDVRPDLGRDHAGRPLRCKHQMQPERAAALSDADQARDEPGQLVGQCGELVNHENESWHRPACRTQRRAIARACRRQYAFTAPDLTVERCEHSADEAVVEVGHQTDHVG